ncbi:hypothetical protein B0O80DRAFT_456803 [Mortierella sp. GBAus27b]|nr:hypothetical protein B0O80DRAFT_456803 [Mortierella sp. GBAus27b]
MLHSWYFYNSDIMRPWISPSNYQDEMDDDGGIGSHRMNAIAAEERGVVGGGSGSTQPNNGSKSSKEYRGNSKSAGPYSVKRIPKPRKQKFGKNTTVAFLFTLSLMLYLTGGALHTAAAFFKSTISLFLEQRSIGIGLSTHPATDGDGTLSMELAQQLKQGYLLMQDVWEHNISHYIYAFGAVGMSWCEMYAYSRQILPPGVTLKNCASIPNTNKVDVYANYEDPVKHRSRGLVVWWIISALLYGAIVAGVACQYPKGLYVGCVYVAMLFFGTIIAVYIIEYREFGRFNGRAPLSLGRHYILQSYTLGAVVAAIAMVGYMAYNHFDMLTSNDKSYLSSISRP